MIGGLAALRLIRATNALTEPVFLDTNILIYAALAKEDAPEKWKIARNILDKGLFATSGQVLAEFYSNVIHKGKQPLTKTEALEWVRRLAVNPCQAVDSALVQ